MGNLLSIAKQIEGLSSKDTITITCPQCQSECQRLVSNLRNSINKNCQNAFCSMTCAASFNNQLYPKRNPEGKCFKCQKEISTKFTYCEDCRKIACHRVENLKLKELKSFAKVDSNRYRHIRADARKTYKKSNRPKCCEYCGYDKHFEVCHIKDIGSFSPDTTIKEINSLDNLVALCRNHHWELDHGHLDIGFLVGSPGIEPVVFRYERNPQAIEDGAA